jgi:hypothetical protein
MVQLMENDIAQYRYDCQFINAKTYWEPSCSSSAPADDTCDCGVNNCEPYYQRGDSEGQPTAIKCITLTYFEAFYFIVVTVSTVGYGDIAPTTTSVSPPSLPQLLALLSFLSSPSHPPLSLSPIDSLAVLSSFSLWRHSLLSQCKSINSKCYSP